MTLQIGVTGLTPHDVRMTRTDGQATVWIDGVACPATVTAEGGATVIETEGRRETVWTVTDRDTVFVHAFGRSWTLTVTDPVENSLRRDGATDAALAPMPGTLVSLAVQAGDEVADGQVVAVIESMKMQTEITAPRAGVVDRVLVDVGGTFDGGAPLVTLVPADDTDDTAETDPDEEG